MQSRLLSPKLCLFMCNSLFTAAEKKTNNLDFEKTLKIQPSGQTHAGLTCQSNLPQRTSLKVDFLFADDISDKTITYLSPGCAKNYHQGMVCWMLLQQLLILVKRKQRKRQGQTKRKKNRNFLLNLISHNPILKVY